MAHRNLEQLSFADFAVNFKQQLNSRLDQIARNLNWQPVERILSTIGSLKKEDK